jgi:hypothetical protein
MSSPPPSSSSSSSSSSSTSGGNNNRSLHLALLMAQAKALKARRTKQNTQDLYDAENISRVDKLIPRVKIRKY